ncbi:hypothetical protein CEJ86_28775 [Sinorhizobium meliloti]|uniref:Uncharacterized protein n=1 Tax=Rhizobium meliloti TaxID=382 RepID=A0A2J0YV05_RHIML|nr:hypothetical protein CEJ86_28775 [Sinorhizobium meliloti]
MLSSPTRMVEPVVVKADAVSKTASVQLSWSPELKRGMAPTNETESQALTVMSRPVRRSVRSIFSWLKAAMSSAPRPPLMAALLMNVTASLRLSTAKSTIAGTSIATARARMNTPLRKRTKRRRSAVISRPTIGFGHKEPWLASASADHLHRSHRAE